MRVRREEDQGAHTTALTPASRRSAWVCGTGIGLVVMLFATGGPLVLTWLLDQAGGGLQYILGYFVLTGAVSLACTLAIRKRDQFEEDEVRTGDVLITWQPDEVRSGGRSAICPVVVLDNSAEDLTTLVEPENMVNPGDALLEV